MGQDAQCCALFLFFLPAGAVFALVDGIGSLVHQKKKLPQTSATCPSSALQEIRAGHLVLGEQDLPSSEGIPIPHPLCRNECSRAQGRPGKAGSKENEQAGLPIPSVLWGAESGRCFPRLSQRSNISSVVCWFWLPGIVQAGTTNCLQEEF